MRTSPGTLCESPSPSVEPSLASPPEEGWSFCQEREQRQSDTSCSGRGERSEPGRSLVHLRLQRPGGAGKLRGEGQACLVHCDGSRPWTAPGTC